MIIQSATSAGHPSLAKYRETQVPLAARATGTRHRYAARTKRIEDIEIGDVVWAWDEAAGRLVKRPVTRLFRREAQAILTVIVADDRGATQLIEATTEHPFWVEGRGWVAASELGEGDALKPFGAGRELRVLGVKDIGMRARVYNFEVDAVHSYFVGLHGVLVHNASERDSFVLGARGGLPEQQARALAQQIADGHAWPKHADEFEGLGVTKKGQFVDRVKQTIVNPSLSGQRNGGDFFYDHESNVLVIVDPRTKYRDGGTAFRPDPDVLRHLPGYAELNRSLANARRADTAPGSDPMAYAWSGDAPNPAEQTAQLRLLRDWQSRQPARAAVEAIDVEAPTLRPGELAPARPLPETDFSDIGHGLRAAESPADWPQLRRLEARVNVTDAYRPAFAKSGVKLQYGDPEIGFGNTMTVTDDGVLSFHIEAKGRFPYAGQPPSGRDMFLSGLDALRNRGVTVKGIEGSWWPEAQSDNYDQFARHYFTVRSNGANLSRQQAAAQTWTGRIAADIGFGRVDSVHIGESYGSVQAQFNPSGYGQGTLMSSLRRGQDQAAAAARLNLIDEGWFMP